MQLTTDDVADALCVFPGDLVLMKANFKPVEDAGVGLVVATTDLGIAAVVWTRGGCPRLSRHGFFDLIALKPGTELFLRDGSWQL